jgi:choline dehydrogenase-like flavoprotein
VKGDPSWDAVIVGAGAGGAATAYGLCTRGLSVLLLDAGPSFDPAVDYPLTTSDWDAREFPEKPGSTGSVTFTPGPEAGTCGAAARIRQPRVGAIGEDRLALDGKVLSRARHRRQHAAFYW